MEKIDKTIKSLDFYTKSNELKNKIIDEQNNYSVADHLFGSMILATAIDSEFKEANNLSKIYRMLFLTEFSNLYPNYDFYDLKLGKQYVSEIIEARDMSNKDGKLVFKYKMLDFILTKLIKDKENNISSTELIKEGSIIISLLCNKQPSECEEIFKFYYLNFRLKNKVRTGWDNKHWNVKSNRIETVSEHIIGTLGLAMVLSSEFEYNLDVDKVLRMLTIHETGETLIGDITPFDGITPEKKQEIEHQAMRDALGNLKEKDNLLALLFEFDEQITKEAKCSHYCDKIEADLQAKIYQEKGMHHSLNNQKNNVVFNSLRVQQMLKDGAKDAFDIWYEWDKNIYSDDNQFPEFMNMLKIARANDLLHLDKIIKERINLSAEEHSFLSQEITDTIEELYKDCNINSIYMTNYQDSKYIKGTLNIVIILEPEADYYTYNQLIEKLNSKTAKDNKTGVNIAFDYDYKNRYSITAMNPSEVHRVEQLVESTILFDKSGNLSRVQEVMKKYAHLYTFYLVDYVPPIETTISNKLVKTKNK
ncbi:MAG: HD family hydrolase [Bacilli bacterium]